MFGTQTFALLSLGLLHSCVLSFNIFVPSRYQPLALNSSSIEIDWTRPSSNPSNQYTQIDLKFGGPEGAVGSGSGFKYDVVSNYSISQLHFVWDPRNISQALQSTKTNLSTSTQYYFVAHAHSANSSFGPLATSMLYAIEGYPYLSGAAAYHSPPAIALLVVLVGMALLV